ncbi:hypothetical protein KPL78_05530 [Roseomonas sp. HJA6]|uniref:DUF4164 family protein n=1 Tax=Roseomonas alba TaxID=2846776 RepID=A0ABS7A4V6_9PROT|nr:hypothetical protein [Neoroseomonas alba]MBW6397300.1 hypothetical protein [Neoroseomonas alba]
MDDTGIAEARQTAALLAAIEAMEATLAVAEALVVERRRIDLEGLEAEVERLCMACLAVPARSAPTVRGRLGGLLVQVDRLQGALTPS